MLTFEESKVFEYYSSVFKRLEKQDGGYYPSRHDPIALSETASHFNISEAEASRIFSEFSKHAADLEREKVKKLPPAARKNFFKQRAHDIFCNNKDLPFYKIEGDPSDELSDPLEILSDTYQNMIEEVSEAGWTIPLTIDIKRFQELKQCIDHNSLLDNFFVQYYSGREFRQLYRKTRDILRPGAQQQTFTECYEAYNDGKYTICRTALISVLEGLISAFNDDPKDVRVMKVCHKKAGEERTAGNNIRSICWSSMYQFVKKLYEKSDFSQSEPSTMNRHWIEHGRTDRVDDGVDCLKLFNAISTMALIQKISDSNPQIKEKES